MLKLSHITLLLLLQYTRDSLGLFLRVETGHQNIAIDGRDTYYGHYTKIHFHNVTCIDAIDIHCLKELTGAEEIDLLYSECQKGHWKVAHYTNSKQHFRLKEPIHALRLLISSRRELSVIDAQVESCSYPPAPPSECHRSTRNHNHRHGKQGTILRAVDPMARMEAEIEEEALVAAGIKKPSDSTSARNRRVRRAVAENSSGQMPEDIEMLNGSDNEEDARQVIISGRREFTKDIIVGRYQNLSVLADSHLKFGKGVAIIVHGSLKVSGDKNFPVIMEPAVAGEKWKGIVFENASSDHESVLRHVNISGSEVAVSVAGGVAPSLDHVIVQSNTHGIQMAGLAPSTIAHLTSVTAVNNEKSGIEYLGKGSISIDRTVAASNGGLGIFITTQQKITIRRSTAYSNNGTGIYVGTSEVTLEDVVVNANGFFGIHAEVSNRMEMYGVNVSVHRSAFGAELFLSQNAKIGIVNSLFHDNKKGSIRFSGSFESPQVTIRGCRFTRNNGEMIVFDEFGNASLIVDKCTFTSNNYADFERGDSVISLKNVNGTENQVTITNSEFNKNSVHDGIKIMESDAELSMTEVSITNNQFTATLATSVITLNTVNATITGNKFNDKRANCEITIHSPGAPKAEDVNLNDFCPTKLALPVCSEGYKAFAMDQPFTYSTGPPSGITANPFKNQDGVITASEEPYLIDEEVMINVGETVIIEPGTVLDFAPGVGITVAGRLVMNGTEERPVVVRGQNGNTWRGIVAKPEGVLDVKNVVSEDASIGIWIDSEKVRIENGRIIRPVVHGVEITQNSNDIVDLGGVIIEEASESAIGVDERRDDVLIKNAVIRDGVGTGIDFMTPTGNIEIRNITIDNMGAYGIHVAEFPSSPLHAVLLEDVNIINQKKGLAGIMITGGWIQNVGLHNMRFADNTVPSLIVAIECNDGNEKLIRLENCTFERNTDIVQHVQLGNCVNLQMEKNSYKENNEDGIGSTLVITSDNSEKKKNGVMELAKNNFTNNEGIYTVTLDSNVHDAYFTDNLLHGNANSGAVLKISGENAKVITNNFENQDSKYQIAYSDDSPIDASFNEWNGLSEEEVLEKIDAKEGAILFHPTTITTISADEQLDAITTVVPVTVPDSVNQGCAHLSYCSRRGTCRDGVCICPHGFTGFDCSIPLFCNCSGNGLCNLLNVCMCNEGWRGPDCSIAICIDNCNGNGNCVSPNQCQCSQGWMGETCSVSSCIDSQCVHGHCEENGLCKCNDGWKGSRCHVPVCSNCSLNGVCTRPGYCSCFEDYGGSDCSRCVGDSCDACDFDCNHGTCEPLTKTCSCAKGWTGGACDVCPIGRCSDSSTIMYIQPSTAEWEDTNAVVNVFGEGFPITENGSYVCTFGRTSVTGHRVSSALLRCPIPANLTLGRHVFSVSQPDSYSSIGNSEAKPIHFTLYDGCEPSLCQGSCVGPLCICPQGKTGIFCDVIEVIPSIDRRFLEHQRANQAFEGVPYVMMLPTLSSAVLRVNSSIPNLNFIASKGIIAWPEPIGSEDPYEISVTAFSPAGQTSISWNVTVAPEYVVEMQNVSVEAGKAKIRGRIVGKMGRRSPVIIRVRRDGVVDEIRAESNANGEVVFDYIPMLPGIYEVTMSHPNVRTDAIQPLRFTIPEINLPIVGESSNSTLTLSISGREDCAVKLLQPYVENPEMEQHGTQKIVHFGRFWNGEVLASVKCGDAPMEIVRAPPIDTGVVPTTPEVLSVYGTDSLYEVKVHSPSHPFFTPDVDISDETLQYLSAIPEDQFLRLTFAKPNDMKGNGTIQVNDGAKPLAVIPYFYAADDRESHYTFKICLRDEWDGQEGRLVSTEVATIAIQNPQRGVDLTRTNVRMNVQWAEFSLKPGIYQLIVLSDLHEKLEEIIELSPLNTTFCVPMISSKSRNLPTIRCSHFTDPASCDVEITSVASQASNNLPYFHFEPSVVTSSGQKILVSPRGNLEGTIGLWNSRVDGVTVTPSRRSVAINESFWITYQWPDSSDSSGDCPVKALNIPFVFLPNSSVVPVQSTSTVLIRQKDSGNEICDSKNKPIAPATSTLVMCNCGDGARTRCRERYHSATACGGAWNKIADDTVSLEVLSSFLSMLFECREVSVSFRELQDTLECVSSIESDCPINAFKKKKRQVIGGVGNMSPNSFGKVTPVLNALDVQTIRISSVFIEFVESIQKMFSDDVINPLDKDAVDHFLGAIGDQSDEGQMISEAERRIIGPSAQKLIQLWNLTVKSWTSGKVPTERLGISHQEAKLLVSAADKVKSITRQNVAQDPFSMLHGYMEKMLETGETEQKECAATTVFIEDTEVEEDGQMRIQVFVKNRANITLTNIGVSLSFVKADAKTPIVNFNIGPSWSAGIGSLTGLGSFNAGASFEIHWTRFVSVPKRLTTVATYQPIIIFSFSSLGRQSQQKLFAPVVRVIPKKTIRAINIIKDSLSPSEGTNFSIISSIINPGYTALKNIQVMLDDLHYPANTTAHLESVFLNGKPTHKSLSPRFAEMPSGSTQLIRVVMRDNDEIVPISSMNLTCLENGKLLPLETTETYAIRAAGISDFGMLLAMPNQSVPLFYFRPAAAQMVNVIKLDYLSMQRINSTEPSKTIYVAAFKNLESSSFGGALWAKMPVPRVGDDHKLTSIVDRGGVRPRELQAVQWISEENGIEMLNWIDSGTISAPQMFYELRFSNPDDIPDDNSDPQFDQLQYRIEIPPRQQNHMEPDTEIGLIEADGDDLTYFLYSPDDERRFSVDSETGRIFYDAEEPLQDEQEYCVVLEARDAQGRVTRVPVAINNGGQRRDCVLFSTEGLTPHIHFGDWVNPTPPIFTPRTRLYTTTEPSTFPGTLSSSLPTLIPTEPDATTSSEISTATTEGYTGSTDSQWETSSPTSGESTWQTSEGTTSSIETLTSETTISDQSSSTFTTASSTFGTSEGTTSSSATSEVSEFPTSPEDSETTATTVTFVDSTLESITTQPMLTTSQETVSSETSPTIANEETTSSMTTLESEGTSPVEYLTSEGTTSLPSITPVTLEPILSTSDATDIPTPDPLTLEPVTSTVETITLPTSEGTTEEFPTPFTMTAVTLEPTSFPTPSDFTGLPSSPEPTTLTSPDATLQTILPILTTTEYSTTLEDFWTSTELPFTSESIWTSTESPPTPGVLITSTEAPPTPGELFSSTDSPPTQGELMTSTELPPTPGELITSTEVSISTSTEEVTKILPTDSMELTTTELTTTELIYTISSDGTLEPITVTSTLPTTFAPSTATEPVYTVSPDSSPETEATWRPPIGVSTVGGSDTYSTTPTTMATAGVSGATVTTATVATRVTSTTGPFDLECVSTTAALRAFPKITCFVQDLLRRRQRSQEP